MHSLCRDKGSPKKFSIENNTVPSPVPPELQFLSQCEEMLIARAFQVMQVYIKPRYGTVSYRGHCVTLPHNVQNVANVLPHLPKDIPIEIFSVKGENHNSDATFRVRRQKVTDALEWLCNNNPAYRVITIDHQRIDALPEDGPLPINCELMTNNNSSLPDNGPTDDFG